MFLQVSVILLTGGTCMVVGGGMCGCGGAHSCWGCVVVGEGGMCGC